jgi:hypothetical protein
MVLLAKGSRSKSGWLTWLVVGLVGLLVILALGVIATTSGWLHRSSGARPGVSDPFDATISIVSVSGSGVCVKPTASPTTQRCSDGVVPLHDPPLRVGEKVRVTPFVTGGNGVYVSHLLVERE